MAALFHAQMNNPIWPDAQPWDMWVFVAVAIAVAVINRKAILDGDKAATAITLEGDSAGTKRGGARQTERKTRLVGGLPFRKRGVSRS